MFDLRNHKISRTVLLLASLGLVGGALTACGNQKPKAHHARTSEVDKATSHSKSHKNCKHKKPVKLTKHNTKQANKQLAQNVKAVPGKKTTKQNLGVSNEASHNTTTFKANTNNSPKVSKDGLPLVNLGNGVQAEEDRGAGQEFVSFKVNNTPIVVHGNDVQPGHDALTKARQIAQHPQNYKGNNTVHINA